MLSNIVAVLDASTIPYTYDHYPEGRAPSLPFICYKESASANFIADGEVYESINQYDIELYTKTKSHATEKLLEDALKGYGWQKTEIYLDDEKCYQIVYTLED